MATAIAIARDRNSQKAVAAHLVRCALRGYYSGHPGLCGHWRLPIGGSCLPTRIGGLALLAAFGQRIALWGDRRPLSRRTLVDHPAGAIPVTAALHPRLERFADALCVVRRQGHAHRPDAGLWRGPQTNSAVARPSPAARAAMHRWRNDLPNGFSSTPGLRASRCSRGVERSARTTDSDGTWRGLAALECPSTGRCRRSCGTVSPGARRASAVLVHLL